MKKTTYFIGQIVPFNSLDLIKGKAFHMCLAHLTANIKYKKFYTEESKNGSFVLMDNGEYERSILNNEKLIQLYNEMHPAEIVLPDDIFNAENNIKRIKESYEYFKTVLNYTPQFMIVPHGSNIDEIMLNLEKIFTECDFNTEITIGIGKLLISGEKRIHLVKRVDEFLTSKNLLDTKIHLLGCNETPKELNEIFKSCKRVRSFDTCLSSIYSFANKKITLNSKRVDVQMNWDKEDYNRELLKENISRLEKFSGFKRR